MSRYRCDECDWTGNETARLELAPQVPKEDADQFRGEDSQMLRTCPTCGNFVNEETKDE